MDPCLESDYSTPSTEPTEGYAKIRGFFRDYLEKTVSKNGTLEFSAVAL